MIEVTEIRRLNLKKMELEYGSQVALAEIIELSPARVNHLLTGQRNIGEKAARKIEKLINKPSGWMDNEYKESSTQKGFLESANLTFEQLSIIKILIAQFEKNNSNKVENYPLTSPSENAGGGGRMSEADYGLSDTIKNQVTLLLNSESHNN